MSTTPDSVVDPGLAADLQAGERVWLKRNWRNIVPPAIITLVPLLCVMMMYRHDPSVVLVFAFFGPVAAWLWVRGLASRLRFTETTVEATEQNWGLSQHRLRLEDIVAARIAGIGLDIHLRSVTSSHYCVYVCRLTPGQGKGSRWVALWNTPYAIKADTLLAELRRRCDLTEISPVSHNYRTPIWPQPTVWQRPGLDPGVLARRKPGQG
jgi:hypothetical protein